MQKALCAQDVADVETKATRSTKSRIVNLQDVNKSISVDNLKERLSKEYSNDIEIITPNNFADLPETRDNFQSWQWCYGKTPKFTATITFTADNEDRSQEISIQVLVEEGIVNDINLTLSLGFVDEKFDENFAVMQTFKSKRYSQGLLNDLKKLFIRDATSNYLPGMSIKY